MLRRGWIWATVLSLACSADAPSETEPAVAAQKISEATPAGALLARSIDHHDPAGQWPEFRGVLQLEELRPDGSGRAAEVELDVRAGGVRYQTRRDGLSLVKFADDHECSASVDGRDPTAEEAERYGLACAQVQRSRNYYLFLWGLPMKLRDPGTRVEPQVYNTEFQGDTVFGIRVTYDESVGSDTWYFYFDRETAALVGYRFYHDEAANDGEYITLEGEQAVGEMRLPAYRRWSVNADDRFLGEDRLVGAVPVG